MARSGKILENPMSGQRIIFRKTAGETGGELLEVESVYTRPTPSRPPVGAHFAMLAPFGGLLGYRDHYPEYKVSEYSRLDRVG